MDIPIPTLLLALSILAVWLPSFSGIRLWVPIFMGAAGAGLYQHVLEPIGVLAIIAAWLLARMTQTGAPHSGRRRVCTLALVLSLVALGSHWLPGFADTVVVPQTPWRSYFLTHLCSYKPDPEGAQLFADLMCCGVGFLDVLF